MISQNLKKNPKARLDAYSVWLSRKGVSLEAQKRFQEALLYSGDKRVMQTYQQLSQVRAQLSRQSFAGPGKQSPELYKARLKKLEQQKEAMESELASLSQAFAQDRKRKKATVKDVAQAMPAGSVLLDIAKIDIFNFKAKHKEKKWLPAHYLAFVLRAGQADQVQLVDLGLAKPIDQAVSAFNQQMCQAAEHPEALKSNQGPQYAERLYKLVYQPLEKHLAGAKTLFVSPDGQLNLVPFEMFRDGQGKHLIERFAINYLGASRDLVGSSASLQARSNPPLLMGNPDFDLDGGQRRKAMAKLGLGARATTQLAMVRSTDLRRPWQPLPHTAQEVQAIARILGPRAEVFTGPYALEEVLKTHPSPRILHLATHGFFLSDTPWQELASNDHGIQLGMSNPFAAAHRAGGKKHLKIENPLIRSGIALAGANKALSGNPAQSSGIMTAEKILGLNLRGTDLVVLSACETGQGEVKTGEGVFGLRRAFTQVGARSLVMSMWQVPDKETQELMVNFYRNLQSGMDRCSALRQATLKEMRVARDRYKLDNPFFWGAFVFLGQAK